MKDGAVLMYLKDDQLYPVVLTDEQNFVLQMTTRLFEPLKLVDHPQPAVNLFEKKKE
ncbi:hypothetical protein [Aureibacillus halotolerans]|uniref:Uncharacterized protein n=1 Tax=Aureibacillus halotolerans TaxID=1508390 RepID=A0A4R6U0L5_9BACI|nr:hypothetical protein [Aureibacillus halotolerans]TDQ39206.1 hypothetical protein EV213_108158 [Aureibacillus halotolerans]